MRQADDLSGVEGEWTDIVDDLPSAVSSVLEVAGAYYLPFLEANAVAVATGQDRVEIELDGMPYAQAPFPYQAKCLAWLKEEFDALPNAARAAIEPLLRSTGCWATFAKA